MNKLRSFIARQIDSRTVIFVIGLGLVSGGLVMVYIPAALIVPGAVLVALAVWRA